MNEKPPVLSYGKMHGASMHLSDDRTVFDTEIQPSDVDLKRSMIVGGILGYAPFAVLCFYTRHSPNALLLFIGVTIFFSVMLGFIYAISLASKINTRIHADREHLSMDQFTTSTSLSRRWERDEIRRVHPEWLGRDETARWGVVIDLPLVQPRLVQGLTEPDARSIADGVRTALNVPDNDGPFELNAPAVPPNLPDIDIPLRHGVIVDRSPHRLTIIVPAGGPLGSLRQSPEALIELDRYMLYVDCADPIKKQESHRHRRSWLRGEIAGIKGDLYGMGVTIRIAGKEMFEFLNQAPEELRTWIGKILAQELNPGKDSGEET